MPLLRTLIFMLVMGCSLVAGPAPLVQRVQSSVALLYSQSFDGGMQMHCTATAFEKVKTGYLFVTAAHCVGEDQEGKLSAKASDKTWFLTFDDPKNKTFYEAIPVAVGFQSRGDDFFVLRVDTKDEFTIIPLGDERKETVDAPVVNVASPYGLGKQVFDGRISSLKLDRPIVVPDSNINWRGALLINVTSNGGSSGSAIVSVRQESIIGLLVGAIGGNIIVAIPVSRFTEFQTTVAAGKYKWYKPELE